MNGQVVTAIPKKWKRIVVPNAWMGAFFIVLVSLAYSSLYFFNTFVIRNLTIEGKDTDDIGLFSVMNGSVYNLGLEGGSLRGGNCGAIVAGSPNEKGKIVNCYTDISVQGQRAGGITDDFAGSVWNCFSAGKLSGVDAAGAVSFDNADDIRQVFVSEENITSAFQTPAILDMRVTVCASEMLNDEVLLEKMNDYVEKFNSNMEKSKENDGIPLVSWKLGDDGHLVFDNNAA